jgi:hypothetical protein
MIAALLLASATVPTAVDAELAFASDAQKIGLWTAFRKWADNDAVIFTPQAAWAQVQLKDKKDPPKAITWRPADSYVSCDGRIAVNTGPWFAPDGTPRGFFTTVWQRTGSTWRWVYDGGGEYPAGTTPPSATKATVHRASCKTRAPGAPIPPPPPLTKREARTTPEDNGRGQSADKTLGWDWKVEKDGARRLRVYQWNGKKYVEALANDIPAPPAQ